LEVGRHVGRGADRAGAGHPRLAHGRVVEAQQVPLAQLLQHQLALVDPLHEPQGLRVDLADRDGLQDVPLLPRGTPSRSRASPRGSITRSAT